MDGWLWLTLDMFIRFSVDIFSRPVSCLTALMGLSTRNAVFLEGNLHKTRSTWRQSRRSQLKQTGQSKYEKEAPDGWQQTNRLRWMIFADGLKGSSTSHGSNWFSERWTSDSRGILEKSCWRTRKDRLVPLSTMLCRCGSSGMSRFS